MKLLKKSLLGLAVTIVSLITMSQPAAAMTITVTGMEYANPMQTTIHTSSINESVLAGAFNAYVGGMPLLAWCVDIFQSINFDSSVNDYFVGSATTFGQSKVDALGRLATKALSQVINSETSGAFQIAAWEIVNETTGAYNLNSGNFKVDNISDQSRRLAQSWLDHLPATSTYSVDLLISPSHQDLAVFEERFGGPATSIPEPATTVLLGLGLFGFAVARRKSAKSQHT
jgi:hypothetical protein